MSVRTVKKFGNENMILHVVKKKKLCTLQIHSFGEQISEKLGAEKGSVDAYQGRREEFGGVIPHYLPRSETQDYAR